MIKKRLLLSILFLISILAYASAVDAAITLVAPANNSFTNATNNTLQFQFNYTGGLGGAQVNSTLFLDNLDSSSNVSTVANIFTSIFANRTITEGVHNWFINATNSTDTQQSETFTFTVDQTRPFIDLNAPIQGFNTSSTSVNFNWTAVDNIDTSLTCNLTINGTVNASGLESANNTATNRTVYGFTDGTRAWNITCVDNATNTNTSITRNFTVDTTKPATTIDKPGFGANVSGFVNTNGTVTDLGIGVNTSDVRLHIFNGTGTQQTITATVSGSLWNATWNTNNFLDGFYNITINASDQLGNRNDSISQTFINVDNTKPTATIDSPSNNQNISSSFFVFGNYSDAGTQVTNVTLIIKNGTTQVVRQANFTRAFGGTWNLTLNTASFGDGRYNFTVNVTEGAGNYNDSVAAIKVGKDNTIPTINLNAPVAGFNSSSSSVNFNWTAIDNQATSLTCNLTIASTVNISGVASTNNTATNRTVYSFSDATRSWNVTCADSAGNLNTSSTRSFTVDAVGPNVTIQSPTNTTYNFFVISLNYTTSDAGGVVQTSCLRELDGTNSSIASCGNTTVNTSTQLAQGGHIVKVWANDSSGNSASSSAISFTVDTVPPNITNVATSSITVNSAVVSWDTNEAANSSVSYGTSATALTLNTSSTSLVTTRSITLSGLSSTVQYFYNVTSCDSGGNCNSTGTFNFTTLTPSNTSTSSGSSGGGGGASGVAYTPSAGSAEISVTKVWDTIQAGGTMTWTIDESGLFITGLDTTVSNQVSSPSISIKVLNGQPASTATFTGTALQFIQTFMTKITASDINSIKFAFKVNKQWLKDNGFSKEDIALFRFANNRWNELLTGVVREDATFVHYTSTSPGMSYFAIASRKAPVKITAAAVTNVTNVTAPTPVAAPAEAKPAEKPKLLGLPQIIGVIAVIAVIVVLTIVLRKKKGKPDFGFGR